MPDLVKPNASSQLSDGVTIGPAGSTFVLYPRRLRWGFRAGEVYDSTIDSDEASAVALPPFNFWDKQFTFSGLMVGGSLLNFAKLGATDAGVPVTIQFENNHTLSGNLAIIAHQGELQNKADFLPVAFVGRGVGIWTEAQS